MTSKPHTSNPYYTWLIHVGTARLYKESIGSIQPLNQLAELTTCHCLSLHAAALQALKRKKRYEKQLGQIDGTLSTIEYQREALENANTNTEVLKNMSMAAKAMKHEHEKV